MTAPDATTVPLTERAALEALAVDLAESAGALILGERPDRTVVHHTKSTDLDVVTVMDTRSEQLLRGRIADLRPDDGVLGEEDGHAPGSSGLTWVLDPIDGTVNYLYDLPAYAVSVAVVLGDPTTPGQWAPVAGAVVNPRTGETFAAHAGGGTRVTTRGAGGARHTRGLAVSDAADLAGLLVATGFSYDRDARVRQAEVVASLLPRVRDVRRMGAAALDLCHVAAGRVDVYYERGVSPWDVAAGVLLVAEAGGVVSGPRADLPPSGDLVVAGGPAAHRALLAAIAEA